MYTQYGVVSYVQNGVTTQMFQHSLRPVEIAAHNKNAMKYIASSLPDCSLEIFHNASLRKRP